MYDASMSGIAGIMRFDDEPIESARLKRMLAHLRHRGPDGEGISKHGRCALVNARFSIIDLFSGDQPMQLTATASHGPLHAVFNGEIFNHRDMRRKLEQRGHTFSSNHSDTEVLLVGYRQFGTELPKHLHGMCAFAIYDEARRQLLLVRDRTGKKPLYVRHVDGEVMFASLAATLLQGLPKDVSPSINRDVLRTYLSLGYTFAESLIVNVVQLPPAHWMLFEVDGSTSMGQYWQPPPISKTSTALGAADAVEDVLREAVASRLEADVPLGCFLSGGVDSGLVAAMAQRELQRRGDQRLRTFSLREDGFSSEVDGHRDDETAAISAHIGAEHTQLEAGDVDLLADLQRLIAIAGEPLADPAVLPRYWLSRAASADGLRVALTGDGGDELFGGHRRYQWMRSLNRGGPGGFIARAAAHWRGVLHSSAGSDAVSRYRSMLQLFDRPPLNDASSTAGNSTDAAVLPAWPDEKDVVHAAMRWDLTHTLPFHLLRKVDWTSMAAPLEIRLPMLDTPVCDLAGHLPDRVLMPGGKPKGLLRQVAAKYLPAAVVKREHEGFVSPASAWLRDHTGLLHERFSDGAFDSLGIDAETARTFVSEHAAGNVDHTTQLLCLLQLSLWYEWLHERWLP